MTIQGIIRDIMQRESITQIELSKRIGVSRQAIQQMLKGEDMKMSTVVMLLSALGYDFKIERDGEGDE